MGGKKSLHQIWHTQKLYNRNMFTNMKIWMLAYLWPKIQQKDNCSACLALVWYIFVFVFFPGSIHVYRIRKGELWQLPVMLVKKEVTQKYWTSHYLSSELETKTHSLLCFAWNILRKFLLFFCFVAESSFRYFYAPK